jgi:hypothetical protein
MTRWHIRARRVAQLRNHIRHKFAYAQNSRCVLVRSAGQESGLCALLHPLRTAQRNALARSLPDVLNCRVNRHNGLGTHDGVVGRLSLQSRAKDAPKLKVHIALRGGQRPVLC